MALLVVLLVLIILIIVYEWINKKYTYWSRKGIKGPKPFPIVGNFSTVLFEKEHVDKLFQKFYNEFPNEKLVGIYQAFRPALIIRDTEIINQILIKDFKVFQDRGVRNADSLNDNLFMAEGDTWRVLRQKLTPLVTLEKLKKMVPTIMRCNDQFLEYIDGLVERGGDCEMQDLTTRYVLQIIGSTFFGIEIDGFCEGKNNFRDIVDDIFMPSYVSKIFRFVNVIIPGFQKIVQSLNMNRRGDKLAIFFIRLVEKIVDERKEQTDLRNDFMDLMIRFMEKGFIERRDIGNSFKIEVTDRLIAAQAIIFFAAGLESSSATLAFLVHELSLNSEIQDRVHKEIDEVTKRHNGKIIYESVNEMFYLEMIFDEILRKYPIGGVVVRKAGADYKLPGSNFTIEKGTQVFIPVNGLHMDSKYYKNPTLFDPQRFALVNKKNIPPCVYLPFGDGPRKCMGMRLAKVQTMLGIAAFLKKFKVEPSHKTEKQLKYNIKAESMTRTQGIWVKITRRSS